MTDPTTPEGRAELRVLCDKATPGPWEGVPGFGHTAIYGRGQAPGKFVAQKVGIPDTKLIIAAVNAIPALLNALERTQSGGRTLGRIVDRLHHEMLDATGAHDLIGEDGDGDWQLVSELLQELRPARDAALARAAKAEAALAEARETIRGYEGAIEGLSTTIGEHRAQLDAIREYVQFLRAMADDVRQLDAVYQARVYDDIATTLERKIGDRT